MKLMDMGPYPVVSVGLVVTAADWSMQAKWFHFDDPWPGSCPHTTFVLPPMRHCEVPLAIVTMPGVRRMDRREAIGYCVHEAVHCWQFITEFIQAGKTGREIEAYSVQWISGWLIKELKL